MVGSNHSTQWPLLTTRGTVELVFHISKLGLMAWRIQDISEQHVETYKMLSQTRPIRAYSSQAQSVRSRSFRRQEHQ